MKRQLGTLKTTNRFSDVEIIFDLSDVDEVRGEGCVVEGVEPFPRGTALVVVAQHPAETQHIRMALNSTVKRVVSLNYVTLIAIKLSVQGLRKQV